MATALITGASAGLGLEFAWQLATARHDVVLVARDAERLERLAGQLRAAAGIHAEVLPADLSDREQTERVADRLRQPKRPVALLVNNAGFGIGQPIVGGDLATHERGVEVMVRALMVLSHAAANSMVRRGRGAILNVSSIAALMASSTYSADKAWVRIFTEALAVELKGTGVTATALCPGLVHTEFHERAGLDRVAYPEVAWLNADAVVTAALADVRRGAVISTPSLRYGLMSEVARLMPRAAIRSLSADKRIRADATPTDDRGATASAAASATSAPGATH